jgi:hypothetical protein
MTKLLEKAFAEASKLLGSVRAAQYNALLKQLR